MAIVGKEGNPNSNEWVMYDDEGRERLVCDDNSLIPAAGDKWKHSHRAQPGRDAPPPEADPERPPGSQMEKTEGRATQFQGGGGVSGNPGEIQLTQNIR